MELNKLEQDFKQKLEKRTIQPTEMAWDRLDAMLSVAEKQKNKPGRNWMYMAASFLALLLVGTFFLNKEKQDSVTNINSVTETRSERETTIDTAVKPSVINEPFTEEEAVATTTSISAGKAFFPSVKSTSSKKSDVSNTVVAATNDNASSAIEVTKIKSGPAKINVDAADLLASVDTPGANETIAVSAKAKKQSVKVNPNSLLSSVEGELDDSFRGKVLQSVSKNYDKIKTSVASRNHQ